MMIYKFEDVLFFYNMSMYYRKMIKFFLFLQVNDFKIGVEGLFIGKGYKLIKVYC